MMVTAETYKGFKPRTRVGITNFLWDRLFGSRTPTRRRPTMPIGVEGEEEAGLLGLLYRPFR